MIVWFLIIYTLDVFRLATWVYFAPSTIIDIEQWLGDSMSYDALIAIPALFVALLIPIAFFLMERQDLYGFDKNVILDKIILARISIPLVFLVSVVLALNCAILSVLFIALLLYVTIVVLMRAYKWMASVEVMKYKTTYRQHMRLQFLRNIKDTTMRVDIWTIILNDEKLMEKNQRGLVSEFIRAVNGLNDGDGGYFRTNLLGLMNRNLSKIDFTDITSYESLVEYSVGYFSEARSVRNLRESDIDTTSRLHRYPSHAQRGLAFNLLRIALDTKNNVVCDSVYYSVIKEYIQKENIDEVDFICEFLPTYISAVKESEGYYAGGLWRWLDDWVVTRDLLTQRSTQKKSMQILRAYMRAIENDVRLGTRLSVHEVSVIDGVTECLLPRTNLILWFDVITFCISSYALNKGEGSMHARIRNYVGAVRDFGLTSGVLIDDWVDDWYSRMERYGDSFRKSDEEAMYILMRLFDWLRDRDEIQKVLDEIANIIDEKLFNGNSVEMLRLESLKLRFEAMLSYIDKLTDEDRKDYWVQ